MSLRMRTLNGHGMQRHTTRTSARTTPRPVDRPIFTTGDRKMSNEQLTRIKRRSLAEVRHLLWIFVYLWLLLSLFGLHRSMILNEQSVLYHQGVAFINAWLLAKVMLTAEIFTWRTF